MSEPVFELTWRYQDVVTVYRMVDRAGALSDVAECLVAQLPEWQQEAFRVAMERTVMAERAGCIAEIRLEVQALRAMNAELMRRLQTAEQLVGPLGEVTGG